MTQTSEIRIVPALTGPIRINLPGPYRRNTPVRHRRNVTVWSVDYRIRYVQAWLAQPVRATRAQHAKVAGLYGAVAVSVSVFLAVVMGK